jgi:exonuclease SbcC
MKPLALEMQAFGPFAGRQVIDFRELGSKTFFLIHGPTGSGKTTILDGICFALFGDSSGGERDGRQMRSHHADVNTLTEVRLDFSLGSQRYRIRRIPEQIRRAKRGGGETRQAPVAELWKVDDIGGEEREQPRASGWGKVTDAIVGLLGFESQQFRQVIMLPQGKFFEFLKSSSQERERILQTLFGTALYRRIEEHLKAAAHDLAKQADTRRAQRQALLDQAQGESLAALSERSTQQAQALEACRQQEQTTAEAASKAEGALAEARRIADRFEELDKANAALKTLQEQQQAWEQRRSHLVAAQRAAAIDPYAAACAEIAQKLETGRKDCQALKQALRRAEAAGDKAEHALKAEQQRAPESDKAIARLARIEALEGKVVSLAAARESQEIRVSEAKRATEGLTNAQKQQSGAADAYKKLAEELQSAQLRAASVDGLREARDRLGAHLKHATDLAKSRSDFDRLTRQSESLQLALKQAEVNLEAAKRKREEVRRSWVAGQAARLATDLTDGQPCPVCGSLEHPAPAGAADAFVHDDALESAEDAVNRADDARRRADGKLAAHRQEVAALQARIEQIQATLSATTASANELGKQSETAEAALQLAEKAKSGLAALQERHSKAAEAAEKAESVLKLAEQAANKASADLQQAEAVVAERRIDVPDDLASPEALRAAKKATIQLRDSLQQALDAARQASNAAGAALAEARAKLEASEKGVAELDGQHAEKSKDLDARIGAAGFGDLDGYRQARLDLKAAESLDADIRKYEAERAAADDRRSRAITDTRELSRPDLTAVAAAHKAAKAAHLTASNAVRDAMARLEATSGFIRSLERLDVEFGDLETRYALVKRVADVANGNNARRMSFQRYVLATLLDEVLAATTLRLRVMSRSRYEMRRKLQPVDQRAAAGLDLEVFDQYTGTTRNVSTLSGGESFLASLALALGLSDVVQAYAGGIRLDAIFVDEGFGTLDTEALDYAIRALKDLQEAGRLVGIVSHVAELKEWIDARLELKTTERGSVAHFVH